MFSGGILCSCLPEIKESCKNTIGREKFAESSCLHLTRRIIVTGGGKKGAEGFEDLGGFGSALAQQRSGLLWIMNFHFSLKPEYTLKFLFIITMSEIVLKQHLWYEITGLKFVVKPIKTGNYHKIRRTQWLPNTFKGPHITSRLKSYLINTLFDF